jgi:hypothetical protein
MAGHLTPPDLREQIRALTSRISELERRTGRGGPAISPDLFVASVTGIAAGTEGSDTVTHGLGFADPSKVIVVGHLLDGSSSSACSWRADVHANTVDIHIFNRHPSATANALLRFALQQMP